MRTIWTTAGAPDPRLLRTFPVSPASVVAATPAGYVTVSDDDEEDDEPGLRIWHPETGALLREFPEVQGRMLVTSGTTALVCGWSDTPQLVDLTTGRAEALPGHRDIVRDLAFAPSALISAGWDGLVRVTDPGTLSAREFDSGDRLNAVAVTTMGGRRVVLAAGRSLHAFDLDTGSRLPSAPPASGRIERIAAWSDSYAMLIADGGVELPGGRALSLPPRRYALDLLALTASDGRRLLALVGDEDVTLWDAEADRPFGAPLLGPTTWPGACVAASGEVITVSPEDRRLAVWQIESGSPERYPRPGYRSGLPLSRGHGSTVTCLAVATDGRIIGGGTDGTVGSWSLTDGARGPAVGRITGRPVSAVAVAEVNGEVQVLAGGGDVNGVADDQLHRWPGTPIETGHRGEVKTIVPAGATTVLTSGCDQTIALIDLAAGKPVGAVPGDRFPNGIAVRDGRAAITRFPGPFQLWDLAATREIPTPAEDATAFGERVIGWAGADLIVTVLHDTARVRDVTTGFATVLDPGNTAVVTAIAAADHAVAVARADGSVSILDPAVGKVRDTAKLPYPATALCWSSGGQLVVACRRDLYVMSSASQW